MTPINEVVATTATARPELINPGDASEADSDGLKLAAGLGDLEGLGLARDGSGCGG